MEENLASLADISLILAGTTSYVDIDPPGHLNGDAHPCKDHM